jgi:hypothetical protein
MKYFKSQSGEVFAYESDGSQDAYIKPDLVLMTKAEVEAHLNPPQPPLSADDIAARRWKAETAGIDVGGMHIDTDDRSKTLINGSALKAMRNVNYTLNWKTPDGFVQIPAEQVLAMADAVADHVQACFDREDELLAALAIGTLTPEMLEEGWPNEPVPESTTG